MGRSAEFPHVYERDSSSEFYQVVWVDPNGRYRRSQTLPTLPEAQARVLRHPDWPYVITYNYQSEIVEAVERGALGAGSEES